MKKLTKMFRKQRGSSALLIISFTLICIFLLLAIFELCCIYIAREETKAASEAIALAVAQELLFFDSEGLEIMAERLASVRGFRLSDLHIGYDEAEATLEKDTRIVLLDKIGLNNFQTVSSSSLVKILYPWDDKLGFCDHYEFGFKPY